MNKAGHMFSNNIQILIFAFHIDSHFVHPFLVSFKTNQRSRCLVTQVTIERLDHLMLWMSFQFVVFQRSSVWEFFFTKLARMTETLNVQLSVPPEVEL